MSRLGFEDSGKGVEYPVQRVFHRRQPLVLHVVILQVVRGERRGNRLALQELPLISCPFQTSV